MSSTLNLVPNSKEWEKLRDRCIRSIPGQYSSLYFLADKVLGLGPLVPMTYKAHWAMAMFAEGATGIEEIDSCRVKMILVPRGLGKSSIISKCLPIQHLLARDDWSVGLANEKSDNAVGFLSQIKTEFETNHFLQALFPERIPDFSKKSAVWAADRIEIPRKKYNRMSPSVLATGVGATVTGVHMSEWLLDDIISQNAAEAAYKGNFAEIESTNRWIGRLQPLLQSPKRDPITVIGTRWWEGDTYEYIEEFFGGTEPVEEYVWNLTLPDASKQTIILRKRGEIAIFKRSAIENGESIFPERYTLEELQEMQRVDPVFFAGQYLLEPAAGAASEFDPSWLRDYRYETGGKQIFYRDRDGKAKYANVSEMVTFMSVDPAISDSNTAARSAVPVVGLNEDGIFLLDDLAERGLGLFELAHKVVEQYIRYRPRKIKIETVVYQKAFIEALAQVARDRGVPDILGAVEEIKSHGKQAKEYRIYALEPFFKRGTFYKNSTQQNFIREYTSFPRGALRDTLDALSFQVADWERFSASHSPDRISMRELERRQLERFKSSLGPSGGY